VNVVPERGDPTTKTARSSARTLGSRCPPRSPRRAIRATVTPYAAACHPRTGAIVPKTTADFAAYC
jgi:hypothetical protein